MAAARTIQQRAVLFAAVMIDRVREVGGARSESRVEDVFLEAWREKRGGQGWQRRCWWRTWLECGKARRLSRWCRWRKRWRCTEAHGEIGARVVEIEHNVFWHAKVHRRLTRLPAACAVRPRAALQLTRQLDVAVWEARAARAAEERRDVADRSPNRLTDSNLEHRGSELALGACADVLGAAVAAEDGVVGSWGWRRRRSFAYARQLC